jgi:cell division protein FtsB
MNVADSIWDKLTRVVIVLLLVAGLAGLGLRFLPLIKQNERMRKVIFDLDLKVQAEMETKKHLSAAIDAMKNDPKAVERLAREKLGYAKAGETVFRFEAPTSRIIIQ